MSYDLTNIDTIKNILSSFGAKAKKSFGQNFLVSKEILNQILESAHVSNDDNILEIGPGIGVLTVELSKTAKDVVAVELDKDAISILNKTTSSFKNLKIVEENALKYEPIFEKYKIVANIPYNITGRLLRHFLEEVKNKPESLTLMVQKEVAQKIIQKSPNNNLLSLSVQVFGVAELVCIVSSDKFHPAPKVDSAVIHIDLFKNPKIKNLDLFFETIRKAFQGKRKMIRKTLNIKSSILDGLQIKETVRPQELTLEQWSQLVEKIVS